MANFGVPTQLKLAKQTDLCNWTARLCQNQPRMKQTELIIIFAICTVLQTKNNRTELRMQIEEF